MDTTQSPSLRELFEAALVLPPGKRAAFVAARCRTAADRERLLRLLAADEDPAEPLPAQEVARLADAIGESGTDQTWQPGQRIGAYELCEALGEGGSAAVFRAWRDLDGTRQEVALKLLRRSLHSPEARRLFRRERQALATLSHPDIAHLIDGGVGEGGQAYLAMEFVEGLTITASTAARSLDLRQRLSLMIRVCRAVAVAHRSLIVHRDLKPSNILVTADGRVKLLDFGIAKLLDVEAFEDDEETRTGWAALTPGYAAPEQYAGGPVSTATDVYALGVVLHELLLGERPGVGAVQRPSLRIGAGKARLATLTLPRTTLRNALRGDLDNIVLKALAEEPERRYASAAELADDLERHLRAEPVRAHPPSTWYRTRKFVQRHRGGVALSMAFAIGVLASLGIALWQAQQAREQAQLAQREAERAHAVRELLIDLFDAEIPLGRRDQMPTTSDLLARGSERALRDLDHVPAVQSDLLTALGRVYDHLGRPDLGEPVLTAAIDAARRVQPPDPALLGAALSERGELELSRSRYHEAIDWLDQALPLQREADSQGLALAVTLDRRALAARSLAEYDAAIALYQHANSIRARRLPADSPQHLHGEHALGSALLSAGRGEEAEPYLRRAAEGAVAHFGEVHVKSAHYLKNLASNQMMLRGPAAAADALRKAVAIERTLYPPESADRGLGLNNLGLLELNLGRLAAAKQVLEEARNLNVAAGLDRSLGQTFVLSNLARVLELLGDSAAALELLEQALATALDVVGGEHPRTATLAIERVRLAFAVEAGRAGELLSVTEAALASSESRARLQGRAEHEARYGYAFALSAFGREEEAAAALELALASLPDNRIEALLLPLVAEHAEWLAQRDRSDQAERMLTSILVRAGEALTADHLALGRLHLAMAQIVTDRERGKDHAQSALSAFGELPAEHSWRRIAQSLL